MIAYIEGSVIDIAEDWLTVQTASGIGYEIKYGSSLAPHIKLNTLIRVYIIHAFSDADQTLYGYRSQQERFLARVVEKTPSIGPSSAHKIVTMLGVDTLLKLARGIIDPGSVKVRGVGSDKLVSAIAQLKKAKLDGAETAAGDKRLPAARLALQLLGHADVEILLADVAYSYPDADTRELVQHVLKRKTA